MERMLSENGYLYPLSYLLRVAREGSPLLFNGDEEWLAYLLALGTDPDEEDEDA